jgi:thiamine transport system permease protein
MALSLALLALKWGRGVEVVGYLSVAASPLVIGTGLFILTYRWIDPILLALPVTVVVNAAMSLPFTLRALSPALRQVEEDYGRLATSLGLSGWARLRIVLLPRLRRPLGFGAGLAAALSMGDLGVITLFADPSHATLPLALYNLMTAYRMEQAFAAALVLLVLSLTLFWLFDRGGRVDADL